MRARFARWVTYATRSPRVAVAAVLAVALAASALALFGPLEVSTSRTGLVSEDEPGQAALVAFYQRFGRPDAMVFVIEGGRDVASRRAVAGALITRLQAVPQLSSRVLGRLDMRLLAEVLVVNHPPLLDGFGTASGGRDEGAAPSASGLTAMVRSLEARVLDALDAEGDDGAGGGAAAPSEVDLARLTPLVRAFDAALRGAPAGGLLGLAEGHGLASGQPLDAEGYLTSSDGRHHLVIAFPEVDSDEGAVLSPLVARMRAIRDEVLAAHGDPTVTAALTGMPALATDELRAIGHGIQVTSLLSALGILLLLMFAFRSLRKTIVVLVPLAAGVLITLGVVELLYDGLNLITASFVPVLMGLGVDIGVHLMYRFGEDLRGGADATGAMRTALVHAGPGVATGTATTAMAFVTVATTEFTAFAELGVITAIGLAVMLVSAFLLIPPLMRLGHRPPSTPPEFPGAALGLRLVARWPAGVVVAGVGLVALSIVVFLPRGPGFNGRYFEFLPDDTESYSGLLDLERDGIMGPAMVNLSAASVAQARALAAALRATPEVGTVHSPTDLLPPLGGGRLATLRAKLAALAPGALERLTPPAAPTAAEPLAVAVTGLLDAFDEVAFALSQAGRSPRVAREASEALGALAKTLRGLDDAGRARLSSLEREVVEVARRALATAEAVAARGRYAPEDLPPLFRVRYVSKDGQALALFAHPAGDLWDHAFAGRFTAAIHALQPTASGLGLDVIRHEQMITSGFIRAALISAALVLLFLLFIFRRVSDALLAMLPVLVGSIWMLGAMKPVGLQLDIANMVALPLLLGIGLDSGAHMIHRYRESLAEGGDRARLSDLVRGTGAAVMVSFLTTMVGFGALIAGDYGAMKSLGLLLVLGVGMVLLASVLLLPAVLVLLGRAR
ncbi:MAG: hypothetical protein CSA66_04775 [Proteobacteria bacterium]|nr:MAG: hypothetical protein CSA66_04775 [Pseudomonadota bacterium]